MKKIKVTLDVVVQDECEYFTVDEDGAMQQHTEEPTGEVLEGYGVCWSSQDECSVECIPVKLKVSKSPGPN